jgi:hypothetical protein
VPAAAKCFSGNGANGQNRQSASTATTIEETHGSSDSVRVARAESAHTKQTQEHHATQYPNPLVVVQAVEVAQQRIDVVRESY